jgi:hypothetical protein
VKPFFRGIVEKWLFGIEMDKMVTNGGPQMHLQMAPSVSKHWGAPQFDLAYYQACIRFAVSFEYIVVIERL